MDQDKRMSEEEALPHGIYIVSFISLIFMIRSVHTGGEMIRIDPRKSKKITDYLWRTTRKKPKLKIIMIMATKKAGENVQLLD